VDDNGNFAGTVSYNDIQKKIREIYTGEMKKDKGDRL